MPDFYVYLISSLPMLHFAARPPFSFEKFLEICMDSIPGEDMELLSKSSISGEYDYAVRQPTLKKWREFDAALRNELVKIRSGHRRIDPARYMRRPEITEPEISHIAMNAHRNASVLEAERMLDQERWSFLDELSIGRYFDIDALLVYSHKLLILQRWENINRQDKHGILQQTLAGN